MYLLDLLFFNIVQVFYFLIDLLPTFSIYYQKCYINISIIIKLSNLLILSVFT